MAARNHVVEHVVLTGTYLFFGRSLGFSTLFGVLGGTALSTHRVWWHFAINLVATGYAVHALRGLRGTAVLRPGSSIRPQPAAA